MSAELDARRTAAKAVAADFHAAAVAFQRGGPQPDYAAWAFRLEQHLYYVLNALASLDNEDEPERGEGAAIHGLSCGCPECDNDEDEPYCTECGADVGIFIGHGDAWLHYRGEGTSTDPVELFDAGHQPEGAWRRPACRVCDHRPHPETPAECGACPEGYCEARPAGAR